jgi:hypothetical protein
MVPEVPDGVERWTAKRRTALVLSILKGDMSAAVSDLLLGPLCILAYEKTRRSERRDG